MLVLIGAEADTKELIGPLRDRVDSKAPSQNRFNHVADDILALTSPRASGHNGIGPINEI
jgi:hypothetical protein